MSTLTTPVEIDTALSEALFQHSKTTARFEGIRDALFGDDRYRRSLYSENDYHNAEVAVEKTGREVNRLNAMYTGWPRYWHVTNNNGHIHNSQNCTSCFHTTQYGWRTDLSGLTEQEVVDREAYNACSVCMPIAPAEQKAARERYNAEQREQRKAEKQAKADEKYAKALVRARKHAEKVEKAMCEMTGQTVLADALKAFETEFSLYGHDGLKSVYGATGDIPAMVGDTLYALKERQEEAALRRPLRKLAPAVEAALTERGLIS